MFNFYVVSMGHDMVTDAGRATTCRRKFKAPLITNRKYKKWNVFQEHEFWRKQFENFRPNIKNSSLRMENQTKEPQDSKDKTKHEPCSQEKIEWSKIVKSIQIQTVLTLQD